MLTWKSLSEPDKGAVINWLMEGNTTEDLAEMVAELLSKHSPGEFHDLVKDTRGTYEA